MPTLKIEFAGHDGSALAAQLDLPDQGPRAFALFAHCFTCGKDSLAAARISKALSARGIAVLRFDFTGLGASGGDFADSNFSSNVDDLVLAAEYLRAHHEAPRLLIGHSLGGTAVLAAARRIPGSVAVATLGAPAEPAHVARQFAAVIPEVEQDGQATVELAGRPFRIQRQFLEDIQHSRIDDCIAGLGRALLVMHSPVDSIVGIDSASRIFQLARHPKSFVSLDDADHLLTRAADADYVAAVLSAWASRFLPAAGDEPAAPSRGAAMGGAGDEAGAPLPAGTVEVAERGSGKFTQTVRIGRHVLLADEPVDFGGDDAGPDPYGLVLAGLGACTTMTVRMYAARKQLPLDGVSVRLRHERIHAQDCADCASQDGDIGQINRVLALEGALDQAQRRRLLEIAERCPVHRTLSGEIKIRTQLADGGLPRGPTEPGED